MPSHDSKPKENAARDAEGPPEEIVTPIEAEIQRRVEQEFRHGAVHKKAIVSVNGEDVGEDPIATHDRAA